MSTEPRTEHQPTHYCASDFSPEETECSCGQTFGGVFAWWDHAQAGSLDAAVSAFEATFPGWSWSVGPVYRIGTAHLGPERKTVYYLAIVTPPEGSGRKGEGPTPATALVALTERLKDVDRG